CALPICWDEGAYDGASREMGEFVRSLREAGIRIRFVGDPYGDNAGGAGNESYYMALYRRSSELLGEIGISTESFRVVVHTKYDEGAKYHPTRKEKTAKILPLLDINDVPGARFIHAALREYRYKPLEDGKSAMSEPTRPMHNWACLHGDTRIRTLNGWHPISDLV